MISRSGASPIVLDSQRPAVILRLAETVWIRGLEGVALNADDLDEAIAQLQAVAWEMGQYRQERRPGSGTNEEL